MAKKRQLPHEQESKAKSSIRQAGPLNNSANRYDRPFADTATKYEHLGVSLIPVKPKSKRPALRKWTGFNNNIPNAENFGSWLKEFGHCGVGLTPGRKPGQNRFVIALDVDGEGYVELFRTVLGSCPSAKFGKKGITFFATAEDKLKSAKIGPPQADKVVELFINSGFVVLPPSIHPETDAPYNWVGKPLYECSLDELPLLTESKFNLIKLIAGSPDAATIVAGGKTHNEMLSLTALESFRLRLRHSRHF